MALRVPDPQAVTHCFETTMRVDQGGDPARVDEGDLREVDRHVAFRALMSEHDCFAQLRRSGSIDLAADPDERHVTVHGDGEAQMFHGRPSGSTTHAAAVSTGCPGIPR